MKTAIIYYSRHHENTKKVLEEIAKNREVTLIDVTGNPEISLSEYDCIGFASGIYYSKFHKTVLEFAQKHMPEGKKTFFIYTYGAEKSGYTKAITEEVQKHHAEILGEFGCFGFNTFGPFKLIGGIAKGHPDNTDLERAVSFYESLQ